MSTIEVVEHSDPPFPEIRTHLENSISKGATGMLLIAFHGTDDFTYEHEGEAGIGTFLFSLEAIKKILMDERVVCVDIETDDV